MLFLCLPKPPLTPLLSVQIRIKIFNPISPPLQGFCDPFVRDVLSTAPWKTFDFKRFLSYLQRHHSSVCKLLPPLQGEKPFIVRVQGVGPRVVFSTIQL